MGKDHRGEQRGGGFLGQAIEYRDLPFLRVALVVDRTLLRQSELLLAEFAADAGPFGFREGDEQVAPVGIRANGGKDSG